MSDSQYSKYDLEERTFHFAQEIRKCLKTVKVHPLQYDDAKQLIRSSGSVAANYIEANESLSKKDFIMRIKFPGKRQKRRYCG